MPRQCPTVPPGMDVRPPVPRVVVRRTELRRPASSRITRHPSPTPRERLSGDEGRTVRRSSSFADSAHSPRRIPRSNTAGPSDPLPSSKPSRRPSRSMTPSRSSRSRSRNVDEHGKLSYSVAKEAPPQSYKAEDAVKPEKSSPELESPQRDEPSGSQNARMELSWSAEDMALRRFMAVLAWGPGMPVLKLNRHNGQGRRVLKFDAKNGYLHWSSALPPYGKTTVEAQSIKSVSREGQLVTVAIRNHGIVGFKPTRLTDAIVIETGLQAVMNACNSYDPLHKRWLNTRPSSLKQSRLAFFG
ncbi:unnamed protein product [Discosporangium mesarthrocarpum]